MNILLTGSGGFIGQNLKKSLYSKYHLFTPRSFELNLTDETSVKNYFMTNQIDFIIHCASVGGVRNVQDSASTIDDNMAMLDNLLKYKNPDTRMILFGSGAMYDRNRNLHKVNEDEIGKYVPDDLYGKSKMLIAQKISKRDDVLCLNIFACYGYDEKESRFPSYAINQALKGQDIQINHNVIFDYLFVEDMQKIVEYYINNKPLYNIINITPTKSVSIPEIANIVNGFTAKPVNIKILNHELKNEYTGDNSRLLKNIPNFKFTEIEDGLKKLFLYNKNKTTSKLKEIL